MFKWQKAMWSGLGWLLSGKSPAALTVTDLTGMTYSQAMDWVLEKNGRRVKHVEWPTGRYLKNVGGEVWMCEGGQADYQWTAPAVPYIGCGFVALV